MGESIFVRAFLVSFLSFLVEALYGLLNAVTAAPAVPKLTATPEATPEVCASEGEADKPKGGG